MEWWGVMHRRAVVRVICAVAGVVGCLSSGAAPITSLPSVLADDARDVADLADASSDSPAQRALSAVLAQAAADKTAAPDARTDAVRKSASPASASKLLPSPVSTAMAEPVQGGTKEPAAITAAVDAIHYLGDELGLDQTPNPNADSDGANLPHRRTNGDIPSASNAPLRSAEQLQQDDEHASTLASALVREVIPWAVGAAVLLGSMQVLRMGLAFGRRQAARKRKHRKSSSGHTSRSARL